MKYVLKSGGMFVTNRKSPVRLAPDLDKAQQFTEEEALLLMQFSPLDLEMVKL